ncbi:hypothetical protein [Aureispira sp. CCB-QB1]|uniref:hypothetical protein n=1 Tax=Aureispira sp. CCB-QB1 TaxID=1313421 RepID=UPI0012DD8D4A|nr:hypothetical protein [Aureispira sp. CCB-QB1]
MNYLLGLGLGLGLITVGVCLITKQKYSKEIRSTVPKIDTTILPVVGTSGFPKSEIDSEKEKIRKKLDELRKNLKPKMKGTNWEAKIFPSSELVKGFEGKYYTIDLIDAISQEVLQFEPGEYVIDDFEPAFQTGIADFGVKIQTLLNEGNVDYKIFIKGSADIKGDAEFESKYHEDYQYPNISFYKKYSGKSKFINNTDEQVIPEPFFNRHLPNLRAAFIREKLQNIFFELESPIILDGNVTLKVDKKDRNATIFLFLPKDLFIIN